MFNLPKRLNIKDNDKAAQLSELTCFGIIRDRHRGDWTWENYSFLVYNKDNVPTWHIEPFQKALSPSELFCKLKFGRLTNGSLEFLAGGTLNDKLLDYKHFNTVPEVLLKEFIARTFGSPIAPLHDLQEFANARISIQSKLTEWGTVLDVIRFYGIQPSIRWNESN